MMQQKREKKAEKDAKKKKKALAMIATGNKAGRIGGGYGAMKHG